MAVKIYGTSLVLVVHKKELITQPHYKLRISINKRSSSSEELFVMNSIALIRDQTDKRLYLQTVSSTKSKSQ